MDLFNSDILRGRTALITGGGSGLGLSIAKRFAQLGADVIICGRRKHVLDEAVAAISDSAPDRIVSAEVCDIRDAGAVSAMLDRISSRSLPNVLVNNAAATFIAQSHLLSARAADAILATTLHGALYCTLELGRRWIEASVPGIVLSILSTSTITGRAFTAPSAIAKSGLLAMTRSLAVEWGPRNIRLVAIAPGRFPTEGAQAQLNPASRQGTQQQISAPIGRFGRHDEIANLATYLVSSAADYMTGEMVVLDGGLHLKTSGADDSLRWSDEEWAAHRANTSRTSGPK